MSKHYSLSFLVCAFLFVRTVGNSLVGVLSNKI